MNMRKEHSRLLANDTSRTTRFLKERKKKKEGKEEERARERKECFLRDSLSTQAAENCLR
jgi:hypothetical protein